MVSAPFYRSFTSSPSSAYLYNQKMRPFTT